MLIKASDISPGDIIITAKNSLEAKVEDVYLEEDSSVKVVYMSGNVEWLNSRQTIFRKTSPGESQLGYNTYDD